MDIETDKKDLIEDFDFLFVVDENEQHQPKEKRAHWLPEGYQKKLKVKPLLQLRTPEEWSKIFVPYPTAEDGYMKAFLPHQKDELKEALSFFGFVVVKVLEEHQCDLTVPEFFMDLNRRAQLKGHQRMEISQENPETLENFNFPAKNKFLADSPAFTLRAFENRTNPVIYDIFCHLFGRKDLWCNIDNWGFFRPTRGLKFPDGIKDRDDWRYNLRQHWDYNPWVLRKWEENGDPPMFQGLVALVDCPKEVGGFSCVPCSTNFLKTWTSERVCPRMDKASMRVPDADPMQNYIQHVPLRKGEMVIWNSAQAHANFPNTSHLWRIHQFIRMLPADKMSNNKDRYAPLRIRHKFRDDPFIDWTADLEYLSPLGKRLIGLQEWPLEDRPSNWTHDMTMNPFSPHTETDGDTQAED